MEGPYPSPRLCTDHVHPHRDLWGAEECGLCHHAVGRQWVQEGKTLLWRFTPSPSRCCFSHNTPGSAEAFPSSRPSSVFSPPSRDNNDMKALRPRCVTDGSCLFCGSAFGSSAVAGILFSTLCRSGGWTLPCPQQSWSGWEHGGGVMAGGSLVTMTVGLHSAGRDGPFPCTFCVPFSLLQFRCFCTSDFELWCISLHLHLKAESLKIWGLQPWVCAGSSPSAAVCPVQLQSVEFLHFLSFNASLSLH